MISFGAGDSSAGNIATPEAAARITSRKRILRFMVGF
jgi:hypothetical protein